MEDMQESSLQRSIVQYLESQGCLVFKQETQHRKGTPDLLVVVPDNQERVTNTAWHWWIEIKTPGSVPSKIQERVIKRLRKAGALVDVVISKDDVEVIFEDGPWNSE